MQCLEFTIEGGLFPEACGKGLVATVDNTTFVGFSIYPPHGMLSLFFDEKKRTAGAFGTYAELTQKSPGEIQLTLTKAATNGSMRSGNYGGLRTEDGLDVSQYFHRLFVQRTALDQSILVANGDEALWGRHAGIDHDIRKKHDFKEGQMRHGGGFFYVTPVVGGKPVLALFGSSYTFGTVKDLSAMNNALARQSGFLTPEQYVRANEPPPT